MRKDFIEFMKYYGIDKSKLDGSFINDIIKYKDFLRSTYYNTILKNTKYGKYVYDNALKSNFNIDYEDIIHCFKTSEKALASVTYFKNDNKKYTYLRFPIDKLKISNKYLDVIFIHELIHSLENSDLGTGIVYNNIEILNEIRVQKLAIKIYKNLRSKNVYIFDNENDYHMITAYEKLFPGCNAFLNKYEDIIKEIAITNDISSLDIFGENFNLLLNELQDDFKRLSLYIKLNKQDSFTPKNLDDIIKKIDNFYNKNSKIKTRKRSK